jgi:hypothetical protein
MQCTVSSVHYGFCHNPLRLCHAEELVQGEDSNAMHVARFWKIVLQRLLLNFTVAGLEAHPHM